MIDMEKKYMYTRAVGEKFHEDGSVRLFPGNTVISRITEDMPIYGGLLKVLEQLKVMDVADKYSFLPPSSYHMTVMEGLCDQVRTAERWSEKLNLHIPLTESNEFMFNCFKRMSLPQAFSMKITRVSFNRFLIITLEPENNETADSLKKFRDSFSLETGIRSLNHDAYKFHISIAYGLIHLTADEESILRKKEQEIEKELLTKYPVIELGKPHLTYFENMFHFEDILS